ncbi:MAG: glycerophosphodiester phosphodiesterase [Sphingopyxis sp.]|nr:glycerophosphodiester phosphodiesterase [Sphingopyxis sp.]
MRFLLILLALLLPMTAAAKPIVIAHRGASGERPEHTLAAYSLAIEQGADFIEPDLVLTKDGVLVARHENEISETTDVADRPEFAARKATKVIDGESFTGWFTEDFTLAELKTLRARERLPQLRAANMAFDGQYEVPTFDEVLALARDEGKKRGRVIGVYPETKHPSFFASIGLAHQEPLLAALERFGHRDATAPVFIQSFEIGNLIELRGRTKLRLIQLMADAGGPADRPAITYGDMAKPDGLKQIAVYANGVGVAKAMVIPRGTDGRLAAPTALVADAHKAGLAVHVWTFRRENYFLPADHRSGPDPRSAGDLVAEIRAFLATGIDGLFSDNVTEAAAAVSGLAARPK